MSNYEIAVVVNAKIEDEERTAVIERVKGLIARFGGEVTHVDDWGRRKLAYEIQKMSEAYYYFIDFESENTDCPNELEQQMRIMDNVLRYLIVAKEEGFVAIEHDDPLPEVTEAPAEAAAEVTEPVAEAAEEAAEEVEATADAAEEAVEEVAEAAEEATEAAE